MKKAFFIALICLIEIFPIIAQQKYTISGYIKDKKNGEDLIGATVSIKETGAATSTNAYGFYSLSIPEGDYTLLVQYVGYKTFSKNISLKAALNYNIEIEEDKVELTEIEVTSERPDANVKSTEMSVNKLDIKQISKIPALLGEVDVIRSIQLLPGVSSVGEGATGFNVRGGSIDQNLVLLDEAPVYNSAHLFGFFSIFNPDAVKDVKLYKGGIPAQYGGRLASLLDVRLKDGNSKRFAAQGGVGIIFSRLTLEGPINKGKGSWIIAGRRSYADALAAPFLLSNPDFRGLRLYYYDLTAKANYNLGKNDKLFVSGYLGRDVFGVAAFGFNWGNVTSTIRWNHVFSDKLFLNLTGFYSNYDYRLGAETNTSGDKFLWKSNIINYSIKPEFTYYINPKNTLSFGVQAIYYNFVPGTIELVSGGISNTRRLEDKNAIESAVYIANEQTIIPRLSVTYGLRLSTFDYIGKGIKQTYSENLASNGARQLIGQDTIGELKSIQRYVIPEPRATVKFEINDKSSVKASYMRTAQYIHLISNTAASIPLDVWTPSTNNIKPQIADQVALGYFRNVGANNDYEFSTEVFYKDMQNQIDYIDGANLLLNPRLEGEILAGKGRAYGAEFFVKKNSGKLTGFISYTLSRTERQVNRINGGDWYPTRFDKPHNLNIIANYQLSPRWSISGNVIYGSGTPVNLPTNKFYYEGYGAPHNPNAPRNNIRIPSYFRFDLTASLKNKKRTTPEVMPENFFKAMKYRYEWELIFGFYNILGSRNAFAVYPRFNEDDGKTELVKFSLFAFPIPSLTYNFKF